MSSVDAALHDAMFSMEQLEFDRASNVAVLEFTPPEGDMLKVGRRSLSMPSFGTRLLKIGNVERVELSDPRGLGRHSYANLTYKPEGILFLCSQFPGHITFLVRAIDVEVTELGAPT